MICYLCKTPSRLLFEKNGYSIYHCDNCSLEQTDLKEDYSQFLQRQYSKEYFTGDETRNAYTDYKKSKPLITKNMMKYIRELKKVKPGGKLLDIGCALGYFVEIAQSNGYDAHGIDPSEYAIKEASSQVKDKLQQGTLDTVNLPDNSFDIITMLDVFEHLNDPESELKEISRILKPDGIILIATGDAGSLAAKILNRKWTFYNPPQHLFYFNHQNINTILKKSSFSPFKWFRVGKWLNLKYILHLAKTTGESFLGKILFKAVENNNVGNIPLYIALFDNMIIIAKKDTA
jgi:2-polyprenyl-3-methyl-5-hydroxy-6-metoxy-1,4-benzoquinol methylase